MDTHVAQKAPGRQSPVGQLVSTGISEFKGDPCVPPAPELAGVDDSGLGVGGKKRGLREYCICLPGPPSHPGSGAPQPAHPTVMKLHVQVPVADTAPGVIAGTQVVAQPHVPQAAHGEGLGPLLPAGPEAEHRFQGVTLTELRIQVHMGRDRGKWAAGRAACPARPFHPGCGHDSPDSRVKK